MVTAGCFCSDLQCERMGRCEDMQLDKDKCVRLVVDKEDILVAFPLL